MDRFGEIHSILKDLYEKEEDVEACMVVRKGFEGVIMFPEDFARKVTTIWEPLRETIDGLLELIGDNVMYGVDKNYIEVLDYAIIFCVLGMTDTSLVVFLSRRDKETMKKVADKMPTIASAKDRIEEVAGI